MVLAGAVMYGTMSSAVKILNSRGFDSAQIAFAQALGASAMLGACALPGLASGKSPRPRAAQCAKAAAAGCAIGMTNFLYYESVANMPASLAIVLLMQFAWICPLIEFLAFGRKPCAAEALACLGVLTGSVPASGMLSEGFDGVSARAVLCALGSAAFYAAYISAVGRAASGLPWAQKGAAIMAGSACAIFAANAETIVSAENFGPEFIAQSLGMAAFGAAIPTALFAAGIPKIGAGAGAILMAAELPSAILCAHFLLGEELGAAKCAGAAIIFASAAAINSGKLRRPGAQKGAEAAPSRRTH